MIYLLTSSNFCYFWYDSGLTGLVTKHWGVWFEKAITARGKPGFSPHKKSIPFMECSVF